MGFFGIIRPTSGGAQVSIKAVHLNVWAFHRSRNPFGVFDVFPSLGQHKVYVDVGIHIELQSGALGHLHIALPAGVTYESLVDLSSLVLDQEVNEFIFGGPVRVVGDTIHYSQEGTHGDLVVPVRELIEAGDQISLLVLDRHLRPTQEEAAKYYIRFRYLCSRPRELIRYKPWGFSKRGIIFDLRASDVRTAPEAVDPQTLLPIDNMYLFAVLPMSYVPVLVNPPLHYSRLLESPHWRSYLDSCSEGDRKGIFTTYYWKSTNTPITTVKPLRAFMHLQNEFGIWFLALYLAGILIPTTVAVLRLLLGQ